MPETIRLRPHHFLCILTYGGAGYTAEFVANMDRIVAGLSTGRVVVEIVRGPDDICGPMMKCRDHPDFHCENESVCERDRLTLEALGTIFGGSPDGLPFNYGSVIHLSPDLIARLRREFAAGSIRPGCPGCEWNDRCTGRAAGGFDGARLQTGSTQD